MFKGRSEPACGGTLVDAWKRTSPDLTPNTKASTGLRPSYFKIEPTLGSLSGVFLPRKTGQQTVLYGPFDHSLC